MQVLQAIADLAAVPGPVCLAIGVFDGVHLGHQAVIRRALDDAQASGGSAVVVTFHPHPIRVLRPEKAPRLITSTLHKHRLLKQLGVRYLLVIPFDEAFAATPPEQFVRELHAASRPLREICVGHAWSFGRGRAGNLQLLDQLGEELGFDEVGIPAVELDGEVVSSTRIRKAVQAGDLELAGRLLGRQFSIHGLVTHGIRLARNLGFPTANLRAHNEQFPPDGVYAVEALIDGETTPRPGVVNIGIRPTVRQESGERLLELHLFDFEGNLYHREVEVFFRQYLRQEQKFPDLDALKAQITRDTEQARAILGVA